MTLMQIQYKKEVYRVTHGDREYARINGVWSYNSGGPVLGISDDWVKVKDAHLLLSESMASESELESAFQLAIAATIPKPEFVYDLDSFKAFEMLVESGKAKFISTPVFKMSPTDGSVYDVTNKNVPDDVVIRHIMNRWVYSYEEIKEIIDESRLIVVYGSCNDIFRNRCYIPAMTFKHYPIK